MRAKLGILFVLITFVCAGALFTLPQGVQAETRDYQVTSDYDSAEEKVYPGDSDHGYVKRSSDLDLGWSTSNPDYYMVGIRFVDVDVPQGATITNAYITFYPDDDQDDPCSLIIYGQDSDDTDTFSNDDFEISSRPTTTASVTWSPGEWTSSDVSNHTPKPTSDIKTIVQEIVNRGGWSTGNSMVFIIDDNGSVRSREAEDVDTNPTYAPKLHIEFTAGAQHTITAMSGPGGSIDPTGAVTVAEGTNQGFTITPEGGYVISDVEVDGGSVGAVSTYTFTNVVASHTIVASFAAVPSHTITATAGIGGTIDPSGAVTVTEGNNQGFTITPDTGYVILDVLVDTVSQGAITTYTFTGVTEDHTIHATFDPVPTYTITATAGANGSIAPSGAVVVTEGDDQVFNITPDTGYSVLDVLVDSVSVGSVTTYTFSDVTTDHTIEVSFIEGGIYSIIATAGSGGSISPSGTVTVEENGSQEFTITPSGGNSVLDVEVDGESVGAVETYTFTNVTSGHTIVAYFNVAADSCVDLASVPVGSMIYAAPANIMFVIDDSGSVSSEYYTVESSGSFHKRSAWWHDPGEYKERALIGDPTTSDEQRQDDLRMCWRAQWAVYSGLYYDPTFTYDPWPTMPNADPDNPKDEPHESGTENLSLEFITFDNGGSPVFIPRAHYYVWSGTENKPYLVIVDAGQIKYYAVTDISGTGAYEEVTELTLDSSPPDDVVPKSSSGSPRTYAEERQNFANYFSYYRRRFEVEKAAIANVIASMQGVHMGIFSICKQIVQPVMKIKVGGEDETQDLLNLLYAFDNDSGTPLRGGLQYVGRYFDKHDGYKLDGTAGDNSPWAAAGDGGECQQAFAIVLSDGFWDDHDEVNDNDYPFGSYSTFQNLGNIDGDGNTAFDGVPYGDTETNMLADHAMYFYERDLNEDLADKVPTNAADSATHQHLVTYAVSFGLAGSFNPDDYDDDLKHKTTGQYPDWDDGDKVDDMWHAAVNGRGKFIVAKNTGELVNSMVTIMQSVQSRISSASSVSVNGDELYGQVGSDILMFQSTYNPASWIGDVKAYHVDINSGAVLRESYEWSARNKLDAKTWTTRAIATCKKSGNEGKRFEWLQFESEQMAFLNDDSRLVDYLRGDRSLEDQNGGPFRNRFGVLGDVVHSSPIFENGYLYVGANDGMMHCLNAATGEEVFAYVPNLVFPNLAWYADLDYHTDHRYYVDLSPVLTPNVDAGMGTTITLLVGGLGKGGKGYYALDVTTPNLMTTDDAVAGKVLWELGGDDDLGYTYSKPTVVDSNDDDLNNKNTGWIVITGNGYNSVNGNAVLFILDPFDGNVLRRIDVGGGPCNGMSTPAAVDTDSDGKVDYVYAGDLKGNLWKFDLTNPDSTNWDVAYNDGGTPKPLFQCPGQPITTQPDVMEHCDKPGYMVIFGTGKFLGASDLNDTSLQSIFGVWDYGDDEDASEYLGTFTRGATPQLSNQPDTVTLLRQTYVPSTESDPLFWTVGDNKLRILTANEPDWTTTTLDGGGSCTDGLGIEGCDPNSTGAHPDPVKNVGWYFDLPIQGERVVSDVMIREHKVIVISYTAEGDPCGAGGTSIIHEIDACSGARLADPQFDIDNSGLINTGDLINIGTAEDPVYVAPSGLLKDGRLQPPAILSLNNEEGEEMKYYSSSSGDIETEEGPEVTQGIGHWRVFR